MKLETAPSVDRGSDAGASGQGVNRAKKDSHLSTSMEKSLANIEETGRNLIIARMGKHQRAGKGKSRKGKRREED